VEERFCETDELWPGYKSTTEGVIRAKYMVTAMRWYAQDEVNQVDNEQNEVDGMKKGADYTGKVMHI